ncbi:hypothetical protein KKC22_03475, partial [Myxococcota bacterium]|nr:hypothetical protein [Myxococcota bacterium]
MRSYYSIIPRLFLFFALSVTPLITFDVQAAEPDPAIYLLIDTSGSMLMDIAGSTNTWGDGSSEHPGVNGTSSRFYIAKEAIRSVLNSYGEVRWGMARFKQNSGLNYLCSCSNEIPNNTSGCSGYGGLWHTLDACRLCDMMQDYPDYDEPGTHDRVCINYAGGILDGCVDPISNTALTGADILVTLGDNNVANIVKWINHAETDSNEGGYLVGQLPGAQPDPELRATGGTPLGGSLQTIYNRLSATDIHADPLRGCRPYSVIILTDGAESCNTNPVSVATSLQSTPDNLSTCTTNAQCPPNSWCSGGKCNYAVKTHVIAFAVAPHEYINCHEIGVAGGAGGAISAQNQAELVAAMAEIIADSIVTELCNGIDDDCDGSADEDFPEKGLVCDNGLLGQCRGTGNYVCSTDGTSTRCNITTPGIPSSAEVCDGIDNNCNGLVDDGITCAGPTPEICNGVDDDSNPGTPDGADDPSVGLPCGSALGICQPGLTICSGGSIVCQQDFPPGTETCNNLDDDCDGMTDEGLTGTCNNPNAFGTCSGLSYCSAGAWICTAANATAETCNNFDDDCDGSIDESLSRACEARNTYGVCNGTETCATGTWGACSAPTPAQDICNGLDDNCDGAIDEDDPNVGLPCSSGCGTYICEDGNLICDGQAGTEEICDGLDNDCDGVPDENLSQNCEITNEFGTCSGVEQCLDGGWEGCTATTPRQEECNGIDDNCDGLSDNEAICPTIEDVCYEGACRKLCSSGEFTCKGTEECIVYPDDPEVSICMPLLQECGMQICTLSEVCVELECINPCETEPCGENETCTVNFRWREGDPVENQYFCVDSSCATVGNFCPDSEFCWNAECVTDPCFDMTCGTMEYCNRVLEGETWVGRCETVCNCRTDQRCTAEGTCEADPCFQNDCTGGTVCIEGECVTDACAEVTCRQGEICVEGGCFWNPCYEVECPAWAQCTVVSGDDAPLAVCKPRPENVTEEVIKGKVTAGGFGCSTSREGGESPNGIFWGLLLATGLFLSRKRSLRIHFLPVLLLGVLGLGACDRAVYTIKDDATINTDVNNNNNNNNTNNTNNINNTNNCTPTGDEACDGLDNDCDGIIDDPWVPVAEGGLDGFMTDPANCGECGNICGYFHGEGLCVAGDCSLGDCDAYYFNNNNDADDGCEYRCNTLGGTGEVCDGLDNDCDGIADEPWIPEAEGGEGGWLTDPDNCGFCGISCTDRYAHAVGDCNDGRCLLDHCEAGWINANQIAADGCETQCIETNGGTEICDGIDNDCDGLTDEDVTDLALSRPCYTGGVGTEGVGACTGGTEYCSAGIWGPTCVGEVLPRTETCDGADNDCDIGIDEDFNFDSDLNYCGSCTNSCLTNRPSNSYPINCSAGTCQYACSYGYHDINLDLNTLGMAGDGCEYACEPSASTGIEFCDGIDNDCDGATDEVADLIAPPAGYCRTGGGCGLTVTTTCQIFDGSKQWVCNYPAAVERIANSPNLVKGFETLCDNLDGDCDGNPDDD